ncbi:MAG: hypothetical protein B7O98_05745 [Zestosphaera tikiterensis]|uniref:Rubrerythrin diiron-binding domain-containing protein n=1 Tax=Zestosphaera tikiterensis TaxID=1973259 RepID=A0A2R7Y3T0_9CREN|nr:MAG: hypothetical protein B7O98_05745 [Zestosphaera tikiterensis]
MTEYSSRIIRQAINSLINELEAVTVYAYLSKRVKQAELAEKLLKLAEMEGNHVRFWVDFLRRRGVDPTNFKVSKVKITFLKLIQKLLGISLTVKLLENDENKAVSTYSAMLNSTELTPEEKEGIKRILEDELIHEAELEVVEDRLANFIEHVRDIVLGMNDGLVEILSVSAGLAGAYVNPLYVAIGGSLVGVGGALSMGIGAYISVKSHREVKESLINRIRLNVALVPNVVVNRLVNRFKSKGYTDELVKRLADEIVTKPELLSEAVISEELGLKEEALEDPVRSGFYTGFSYLVGALIPLTPYFTSLPINVALATSFLLASAMLFLSGTLIAITSNLSIKKKALEMVLTGVASALITYLIGAVARLLLGIEV